MAIGIEVAAATFAISSGISGGVGSSNHSGVIGLRLLRQPPRAPETVNCPCVPNSRSQRVPTASRMRRQNASLRFQPLQARLARIEGGVRPRRIELHRRKPHADIVERPRRRRVGIGIDGMVGVGASASG